MYLECCTRLLKRVGAILFVCTAHGRFQSFLHPHSGTDPLGSDRTVSTGLTVFCFEVPAVRLLGLVAAVWPRLYQPSLKAPFPYLPIRFPPTDWIVLGGLCPGFLMRVSLASLFPGVVVTLLVHGFWNRFLSFWDEARVGEAVDQGGVAG